MKLDAFLTLDAVLRGGTLAAAAAEMDLTPSAVSMKMKQLEVYMGQPLFDRSGAQVRPTRLAPPAMLGTSRATAAKSESNTAGSANVRSYTPDPAPRFSTTVTARRSTAATACWAIQAAP